MFINLPETFFQTRGKRSRDIQEKRDKKDGFVIIFFYGLRILCAWALLLPGVPKDIVGSVCMGGQGAVTGNERWVRP